MEEVENHSVRESNCPTRSAQAAVPAGPIVHVQSLAATAVAPPHVCGLPLGDAPPLEAERPARRGSSSGSWNSDSSTPSRMEHSSLEGSHSSREGHVDAPCVAWSAVVSSHTESTPEVKMLGRRPSAVRRTLHRKVVVRDSDSEPSSPEFPQRKSLEQPPRQFSLAEAAVWAECSPTPAIEEFESEGPPPRSQTRKDTKKRRVCFQMEADIIEVSPKSSTNDCCQLYGARFRNEADIFLAAREAAAAPRLSEVDVLTMALASPTQGDEAESGDDKTTSKSWESSDEDLDDSENNPNLGNLALDMEEKQWATEKQRKEAFNTSMRFVRAAKAGRGQLASPRPPISRSGPQQAVRVRPSARSVQQAGAPSPFAQSSWSGRSVR